MVTDEQWTVPEPLNNTCRPNAKVPSTHLHRAAKAIFWRHENGAKWRALPAAFDPWWMAAIATYLTVMASDALVAEVVQRWSK